MIPLNFYEVSYGGAFQARTLTASSENGYPTYLAT